jgi:hypothetical protein
MEEKNGGRMFGVKWSLALADLVGRNEIQR